MSEDTNEGQQSPEQDQVEKEARMLGWVPKEEFRDGDHWVDADAFVKRGKEINPILRKNNETLLKKLDEAQREVAEVKKVAKEFEKFQKESAAKQVRELESQLVALKEQKKTAITQGDGDSVVAIDEQIDAIKEAKREATAPTPEAPKPTAQALDPIFVDWMNENPWFTQDAKMTRIADNLGVRLNAENPELKGKAFFEALNEELELIFPDKLKKLGRKNPVEGGRGDGNNRPSSSKKQSYDNLPPDAKAACDKFVKQGFMTRESYVAEYDWS